MKNRMIQCGVSLLLMVLTTIGFASIETLQAKLDSFKSLKANFKQTITLSQGKKQTTEGTLWVKKPNQFRWAVSKPNPQLYLTDGKQFWTYDKELAQATVQPLDKRLSQTPILLLSGKGNVNKLFKVEAINKSMFKLWPKRDKQLIAWMEILFSQNKPEKLILMNQLGQKTEIEFSEVSTEIPLANHLFTFEPPKNVDVLGSPL